MRIQREALLKVLESVSPGLAPREIIEQSSCLVFTEDGRVCTFNDEVCASRVSPLKGIVGAVKAKPLIDLLSKMAEEEIEIEQTEKELRVKGKGKRAVIPMEMEIKLPVASIAMPDEYTSLAVEFSDAVGIVHSCASGEESLFSMTCVHIHPEYLEACDRNQIAHYPLKTGIEEMLVRGASLKKILGFDMTEVGDTPSWLHFRNPAGLVISVRKYLEEYPPLSRFLSREGISPIALPGGLAEAVEKATIFSSENSAGDHVLITIKDGWMILKGMSATGWYEEGKKVEWNSDPISFLIAPKLLVEISKRTKECGVGKERLFIDGGKFVYVTSTMVAEKTD